MTRAADLPDDARPAAADSPFTVTVDDEIFTVTITPNGGASYSWESGPNPGYGFSSSPPRFAWQGTGFRPRPDPVPAPPTIDDHRRSIRAFLHEINPETGYLD
ncbi:hypothetical protein [Nocardia asteroides]|uniref:hypothetical protein n=1 Tax=Nocardia asteroides TaxID=1824 RepID=UPI0034341DD9